MKRSIRTYFKINNTTYEISEQHREKAIKILTNAEVAWIETSEPTSPWLHGLRPQFGDLKWDFGSREN